MIYFCPSNICMLYFRPKTDPKSWTTLDLSSTCITSFLSPLITAWSISVFLSLTYVLFLSSLIDEAEGLYFPTIISLATSSIARPPCFTYSDWSPTPPPVLLKILGCCCYYYDSLDERVALISAAVYSEVGGLVTWFCDLSAVDAYFLDWHAPIVT